MGLHGRAGNVEAARPDERLVMHNLAESAGFCLRSGPKRRADARQTARQRGGREHWLVLVLGKQGHLWKAEVVLRVPEGDVERNQKRLVEAVTAVSENIDVNDAPPIADVQLRRVTTCSRSSPIAASASLLGYSRRALAVPLRLHSREIARSVVARRPDPSRPRRRCGIGE